MTFYFYDLETSSGSPRTGRIMQFAGQRTDKNLKPIDEPHNILIKLADDVLPEPDAILVHGITPQKTLEEGVTEAEFLKLFHSEIAAHDTVFVGFNNIRFDDEFMRRACYRSFYDPYQWHWQNGRSRWDLLDPFRMMRALRPEGLKWPMLDGKPTVKLGLLAKENKVLHENAHDALSDVQALIELTRLFKTKQPKLFDYLLSARSKKAVAELAENKLPFVYTSGKYSSDYEKTTVVQTVFRHPRREAAVVWNLRESPEMWSKKTVDELVTHWTARYVDDLEPLPVKTLQFNRCPAVAPIGVLDEESQKRLKLDMNLVEQNRKTLLADKKLVEKLEQAIDKIENAQQMRFELEQQSVDQQLYDGFWSDNDQAELEQVRKESHEQLESLRTKLKNKRLRELLPLYIGRNFPATMSPELRVEWEEHRRNEFYGGKVSRFSKFSKRMQELAKNGLNSKQEFLLTELQLYVESVLPEPSES